MWLSGEKWVLPQALSLCLPLWQCFLWLYIFIACINARKMTKNGWVCVMSVIILKTVLYYKKKCFSWWYHKGPNWINSCSVVICCAALWEQRWCDHLVEAALQQPQIRFTMARLEERAGPNLAGLFSNCCLLIILAVIAAWFPELACYHPHKMHLIGSLGMSVNQPVSAAGSAFEEELCSWAEKNRHQVILRAKNYLSTPKLIKCLSSELRSSGTRILYRMHTIMWTSWLWCVHGASALDHPRCV